MSLEQLSKTVDFVQAATPSNPNDGETYLDTSLSPPRLKVFDAEAGAFVSPRSIQNLDAPVSQAGASAEVKRLDLRFVREMSRLFFDRSLADINFSDGIFEIFADTANVTTSSGVVIETGTNGRAVIGTGFNISNASVTGVTLNSQDVAPQGAAFSNDGTTLITVGFNSDQFYEFSLSAPFDISTARFTGTTLSAQGSLPTGLAFSNDGTTLIQAAGSPDQFFEYSLNTPFDISTASFTNTTLANGGATGVVFSNDGTTMIEVRPTSEFVEYSLNTAFDISTASTTGTTLSAQDNTPTGAAFSNDGTTLITVGEGSGQLYEYSLSTPFDIGTATFTNTTLTTQDSQPTGVAFSSNGATMTVVGGSNQLRQFGGAIAENTGTGTVSKSVTLAFTPSTAVLEDTRENGLNASYDITDGNGNTVTVSQSEIGTTVDCSTLTDGSLTVTANLDNPTTAANAFRDFAVYFD